MSVDPEQPPVKHEVPLRWGIDGPIIGTAFVDESDPRVIEAVIPEGSPNPFSRDVVDLSVYMDEFDKDSDAYKIFTETRAGKITGPSITIKKHGEDLMNNHAPEERIAGQFESFLENGAVESKDEVK